jgi:hypothetical protein
MNLVACVSVSSRVVRPEFLPSRLDSIGIAGFSHDFRTLDGAYSPIAAAFESLSFEGENILSVLLFMLGTQLPFLVHLPVKRNRIIAKLRREMGVIAADLLEKTRHEKRSYSTDENTDKSVIGLLRKDLAVHSRFRC